MEPTNDKTVVSAAAEQPPPAPPAIPDDMTMDLASDPILLAALRRANPRYGISPSRFEAWIQWLHGRIGTAGMVVLFALLSAGTIWISSALHMGDGRHEMQTLEMPPISAHNPLPAPLPGDRRQR